MFSKSSAYSSETYDSQYLEECEHDNEQFNFKFCASKDENDEEEMKRGEMEKEKDFYETKEREQKERILEEERKKREDEDRYEQEQREADEERQKREEKEKERQRHENEEDGREKGGGEEEVKRNGLYHCLYRYGIYQIKLQYDLPTKKWNNIRVKHHPEEEKQLNMILTNLQNHRLLVHYTLDEQIQIIKNNFHHYFLEMGQMEKASQMKNNKSISSSVLKKGTQIYYANNKRNELSLHHKPMSLTIHEKQEDTVGYNSYAVFTGLAPPPVAPRRSRQNSTCSTKSSVRYASFNPPPTAPVRRRRVIESILLHVQRKKKILEKIVDTLRGVKRPTMHDLGLDFLRVYDGRFNYRVGHTFVMSFRKKTWFLTIDQIKYVDCPVGEIGPRSVLILIYKGQCTSVHV